MSEVKWIKLSVGMFDDEKIDFIESMPEADAIMIIWVKLLALAGKCNDGGLIYLTNDIPYSPDMLAHKFKRPLNTVKLALDTLVRLEMIYYTDEEKLMITNWDKHQNIDGLNKVREQTRKRVAEHRKKKAEISAPEPSNETQNVTQCNVTGNATVTLGNATELEKELDIEYKNICAPEVHDAPPKTKIDLLSGFDEFWSVYPKKVNKKKAQDVWKRIKPDTHLQAVIVDAVKKQAQSAQWTKDGGQFIPHSATWLNAERWNDQVVPDVKRDMILQDTRLSDDEINALVAKKQQKYREQVIGAKGPD